MSSPIVAFGLDHRALEARQDMVAEPQRLAEVLEAEGLLLDVGLAVVVGRASRREHERVVSENVVVGQRE